MDTSPPSSSFASVPSNRNRNPKTPDFNSLRSSAMRKLHSGNSLSSSDADKSTKAVHCVAQQLASPESPSRSTGEAAKLLAGHKSPKGKEVDRNMFGNDSQRTRIPASIPLLHLSPEQHVMLQEGRSAAQDLAKGRFREMLEENVGEMGDFPEATFPTFPSGSNSQEQGETLATTKAVASLREGDSSTPKPTLSTTDFSQSQRHEREVKLLVSTLNFDQCTQFAKRAYYCGPPGKWALFDEFGSQEVSLITNVSSEFARKAFSYLTGKRLFTLKAKPLCVMYIEPRNGGEVLIRGLSMAAGPLGNGRRSTMLMRKLCDFLGDFEM
ncbi:hypothetical protein N0V93_006734 [Gnomoniopsis smithogilvyi]|uniref:Uncharacterized protein n=1 Tax=Gnomoniopsis smithogilvyi TaxID=1191159 RepID=A0A9W9CV00_9PEZI|nr:hypothetical protein N0V93_006734 [Gnomoniopsis smithogilvyi]